MKKYLLMAVALFVGTVCFTSCGDDEEEALENVASGKTKPTVTVNEQKDEVVLTAVWKDVATYTITATFEYDVCTNCIGQWTWASDRLADEYWAEVKDAPGYSRNGKTITEDMTDTYGGMSKGDLVTVFSATKAALEKQEM